MKRPHRLVASFLLLSIILPQGWSAQEESPVALSDDGSSFLGLELEDLRYSFLLRAFYGYGDAAVFPFDDSVSSLDLEEAQITGEYTLADSVLIRTQLDVADGVELEDAYVAWSPHRYFGFKFGQFRPRVLFSATADPGSLVFRDRTFLGERFDFFEPGIEWSGSEDTLRWFLAALNGTDGGEDGIFASARLEWSVYEGELPRSEGTYGVPDYLRSEFGFFGFVDTSFASSTSDASGFGLDFAMSLGPWYTHAEVAHVEDAFLPVGLPVLDTQTIVIPGEADPFSVTFGRRFGERIQTNLRWQRPDDVVETDHFGLSSNYLFHAGDETRVPIGLTAEISYFDSNRDDGFAFSLGVSYGSNRANQRP